MEDRSKAKSLELALAGIEKEYGRDTARWFGYLSSMYNLTTERADLRSWQTLPDQIRLARLMVDPGDYEIFFDDHPLDSVSIKAGEK